MDTPDGFLQMSHALGLNDTLWVRPEASTLRWADISLYANPFNDIAARTVFEAESRWPRPSSTSPEFTMDGSYPKCWRKETNGILMYKTGSTGLEPYAEFMAAQIAKTMQDVHVVEYGLARFKGHLCSTCRLFTDESTGFVPAARLLPQHLSHNMVNALDLCRSMGFEREFYDMVVLDAVTLNQDRHMYNFGFLVDNDTFRIKSFAPLFDFNISMLCFATNVDLETDAALDSYLRCHNIGHKLGGDFVEVAQALMTPERRARMAEAVSLPRHPLHNLPDKRMDRLAAILERNYDCIRNGRGYRRPATMIETPPQPDDEHDLPPFLIESIAAMQAAWDKLDRGEQYINWDCDYCQLQSDINNAEVNLIISPERAWHLREKYLRIERP